jgi:peptidoglycan/xylan/chitin deacetylase (PgdA/CDA1 family)
MTDGFWPNDARLALTISLMFESGGQPDVGALGPLASIPIAPEYPDLPTRTYFEYGYLEGIPRLLDLFDRFGVKVTSFMVGQAVDRNPDVAQEIVRRGHECAAHGVQWVPQWELAPDEERAFIRASVDSLERATGQRPVGWNCFALRGSVNTVGLLQEEGFLYHIDDISCDEPFVRQVNGQPFVTVPYSLHLNDLTCYELQGFSTMDYLQLLKDEFDVLYAEGRDRRRMMVVCCHDRVAGRPARVKVLADFFEYAQRHDGVWFARKDEIARFVLERGEAEPPRAVSASVDHTGRPEVAGVAERG